MISLSLSLENKLSRCQEIKLQSTTVTNLFTNQRAVDS